MNPRFLLQSPKNKPRWLVLFLVNLIAALPIATTTVYFKKAIAQTANPTLSVDVKADRHPISPDIYGMNDYPSFVTLRRGKVEIRDIEVLKN